ncbi:MAG: toxic anion resistance protein [Candidatus Cohnella colombiensis]|uniref:Toxic anion resistance protein n=1 Tax=Candidatus Cohnella colombiensis TaxID=3121368 RepID=A0AA95JGK8_9BACL|nr:MAG: toxic anion resistance protein [Cohnella sp.]
MSTQLVSLKKEDEAKVIEEASQIIQKVSQADDAALDSLMDEVGKLGAKTQERAGQTLKLLERPVNELMTGKSSQVSNLILSLRNEAESLQQSKDVGFFGKLFRKSPFKNYVYKYQSVKTNIEGIVAGLRDGKDTLEENIVSMRSLKKNSIEEVYNLQYKISMGNQLKTLFEEQIALPENESRKVFLERGLRKVVTRIQSMTEEIMLFNQAIAATDIINDTNDKLIDSVNNSIYKTTNLITISAMITMALEDQMKVAHAVEAVNSTIEEQFKRNAEMLKTTTEKSAELLKKPSMSMEAVNQAINDLMSALDTSEKSNRDIIDSCKDYTVKMTAINQQMTQRLGLETGKKAEAALPEVSTNSELDQLLK